MKTRRWNIICLVWAFAIVAGLFVILPTNLRANKLLSDADLDSLFGGAAAKCCDADSYCDCNADPKCEEIVCVSCKKGGTTYYCSGKSGDLDRVENCWKSSTESDTCTYGSSFTTSCSVDVYSDTGCNTYVEDGTLTSKHCS